MRVIDIEINKVIEGEEISVGLNEIYDKLIAINEAYQAIPKVLDGDSYTKEYGNHVYMGMNMLFSDTLREFKHILNKEA